MIPNIYDKHHITCWKGCSAAASMLRRSMKSLILATVLCITFSAARNVPEEEALEITARRAPSWTAKVSHKHMCSWCNGINEALAFSQQVCICKICWIVECWCLILYLIYQRNQWCAGQGCATTGKNTVFDEDLSQTSWHENWDGTLSGDTKVATYECKNIRRSYPFNGGSCKYVGNCYPGPFDGGNGHLYYKNLSC